MGRCWRALAGFLGEPEDLLWPAASLRRNSLQQAGTARLRCLLSRRPKIVSSVQLACFPGGTRGTGGTRRANNGSRWNRKGEQREQTREPKQDKFPCSTGLFPFRKEIPLVVPPVPPVPPIHREWPSSEIENFSRVSSEWAYAVGRAPASGPHATPERFGTGNHDPFTFAPLMCRLSGLTGNQNGGCRQWPRFSRIRL